MYAVFMALLNFGLLSAGEVRMIEVEDVTVTDNEKLKRIHGCVSTITPQYRNKLLCSC